MKEKTLKQYMDFAKSQKKQEGKALQIALLSNFSINGLKEVLEVKCGEILVNTKVYEAGYDQISQEILDSQSGLNLFKPDITFILISPKQVFEGSCPKFIGDKAGRKQFAKKKSDEFIQTINFLAKNSSGLVVVSNLKLTSYSCLGINDEKTEMTNKDMVIAFNQNLKQKFLKSKKVFVYDFAGFFTRFGEYNVVSEKMMYFGKIFISPDYLPQLAEDLMGYVKALCSKNRKCIVLDLDNTLWGGIVGEDGFNNIRLGNKPPGNAFVDFQKHILELHKRGIILAINSSNNEADALKVIRKHPDMVLKEKHFTCIKINWEDKASNMKEIVKEINIGINSLVFIDDDAHNREIVKQSLPEVKVVDLPSDPSLYVRALKELNDFNTLQLTEEDFKKGKMYNQQKKRTKLKTSFNSLQDFLKNLKMEVEIKKANDFTIPRISQLTQKTNQFNLMTRRHTEGEIKKFVDNKDCSVYAVYVKDRLGDNGLTGAIILKKEKQVIIIETFLLSCRVIGRNVEKAMLGFIAGVAQKTRVSEVIGEYIPTEKNKLCKNMYEENGFKKAGKGLFKLTNFKKIKPVEYIRVGVK